MAENTETAPEAVQEYPKWVKVNDAHIVKQGEDEHIAVPAFPEFHVNRVNQEVTVLVKDEDEEALATNAPKETSPPEEKTELPPTEEK